MSERRKIIVSGGRNFADWAAIYRELLNYPAGTILVHGDHKHRHLHSDADCPADCPRWTSTDKIADRLGRALGFEVIPMAADWDFYGRAAGPIRNAEMVKKHRDAERAIVFDGGPGTRDFTSKAVRAHIPVYGGGTSNPINISAAVR